MNKGVLPNGPISPGESLFSAALQGYTFRESSFSIKDQTMSDIAERVKKIVIEHLNAEAEKVTENARFIDDLGADSLDTVELVMAFEEEFNVEIPDDAAESIVTVGDAVKFITSKAAA